MCRLFLNKDFQLLWKDKDPFREAFAITGEDYRKIKARHTLRFEQSGKGYFIKLHSGIGLKEYFKDIFQWKKPVTGAGQEFDALALLHKNHVPTMTAAAFGCRGNLKAYEKSFLITEELTDVVSLEDLCKENGGRIAPDLRKKLIFSLAESVRKMHKAGLNHRDCYICHFLLKKSTSGEDMPVLYVIDLHRAQIRKKVPFRYLVKDLAGLYFSAMTYGELTRADIEYFLEIYFGLPYIQIMEKYSRLLQSVQKAAEKLYKKDNGKNMPSLF
ncbi:MAG: lipopolysaccharide core heptose(I) kinase RfaP [Lentisphaeria bacterium]|nr:lipopolysaccharide core heptose(I) kinase RfaP [Lentisphaeria bacterium]